MNISSVLFNTINQNDRYKRVLKNVYMIDMIKF